MAAVAQILCSRLMGESCQRPCFLPLTRAADVDISTQELEATSQRLRKRKGRAHRFSRPEIIVISSSDSEDESQRQKHPRARTVTADPTPAIDDDYEQYLSIHRGLAAVHSDVKSYSSSLREITTGLLSLSDIFSAHRVSEDAMRNALLVLPQLHDANRLLHDVKGCCECSICLTLMYRPWSLHCGHVFCEECLGKQFHASQFSCPACRAPVHEPPIPCFAFRNIARAMGARETERTHVAARHGENIWGRFFSHSGLSE